MIEKKVIEQSVETRSSESADRKPAEAEARLTRDDDEEPRKYSKRRKRLQEFERHASKGLHRLAKSVEAGIREWRDATDRSARKRKDGALRDALDNSARAVSKQLRVASRAPQDAARALRSLKITKALRRVFPL
jgi:hypothetical protein